jgi:hypothetical protein
LWCLAVVTLYDLNERFLSLKKKKKKKNIDSSFLFLITFFLLSSFTSSFFFSLLFFFLLLCSTHPNTEREERVRLRGREGEIREMRFERERERGRD